MWLNKLRLRPVTFVTESLTLMAGTFSSPFFIILYRLWTPVVVSSDNPRMPENVQSVFSAFRGGAEEEEVL